MAQLGADDFERADGGLGASWTANSASSGDMTISTGFIWWGTVNLDIEYIYNPVVWPSDQYSQITHHTTGSPGTTAGYGVVVRCSTSAKTYYRLVGSASGYGLQKLLADVETNLSTGAGTTFTAGDTMMLEVSGGATTTFRMYKNGVQFGGDVTDSSSAILTGNAGVGYSSTDNTGKIASWLGGSLAAAPSGVPKTTKLTLLGVG